MSEVRGCVWMQSPCFVLCIDQGRTWGITFSKPHAQLFSRAGFTVTVNPFPRSGTGLLHAWGLKATKWCHLKDQELSEFSLWRSFNWGISGWVLKKHALWQTNGIMSRDSALSGLFRDGRWLMDCTLGTPDSGVFKGIMLRLSKHTFFSFVNQR